MRKGTDLKILLRCDQWMLYSHPSTCPLKLACYCSLIPGLMSMALCK